MRHLVYRVQALSQSLLPLVWDFGTLKSRTEKGVDVECAYITQMIKKFVSLDFNKMSGCNYSAELNFDQHGIANPLFTCFGRLCAASHRFMVE